MKRIYIVRHAKSSWVDLTKPDIQRPLNKRGKTDSPVMARHCLNKGYVPQLMISSNAERALETSKLFLDNMKGESIDYKVENSLYHAPEDTYFEVCSLLEESIQSVMLFGHNPGITYLANSVSNDFIDNVPTCAILVIDSDANKWDDVDSANCKLIDFVYPKKL